MPSSGSYSRRGDHEFSIFFQLDQGSTQQLAGTSGLGAPVRMCISRNGGEQVRIDVDEPTTFLSQFPELAGSSVPAMLDRELIDYLVDFAS